MQVAATRPRAVAGVISLVLLAASIAAVAPASAAVSEFSGTIGGPGATRPGKAVELTVGMTNSATKRGVVPDLIKQVKLTAGGVRYNGRARGMKVCKAKPRRDSYPTRCPRGSQGGSGRIAALREAPCDAADRFRVFLRPPGRALGRS